jgi:predicted branched-subunit amino acid permease
MLKLRKAPVFSGAFLRSACSHERASELGIDARPNTISIGEMDDQQRLETQQSKPASLTLAGTWQGMAIALPFGASSLLYGIGFGVLAAQVGLSIFEAVAMSATVFSGTAQIAILQAWSASQALLALFATVMVVNSRYILMSAALRPWLGQVPRGRALASLLILVDGSFAMAMRENTRGNTDAGILTGSSLVSYIGWVLGTALGYWLGALLPDPRVLALDFLVLAFCASAAALMWKPGIDWWPPLAATLAAVAVQFVVPGAWAVAAAGLTGALAGAWRYQPPAEAAP